MQSQYHALHYSASHGKNTKTPKLSLKQQAQYTCKNCSYVCAYKCTIVVHSTALNSSDNLPSYPSDNHHSSESSTTSIGEDAHSGDDSFMTQCNKITYYIFYCALLELNGIQSTYSTAQNFSNKKLSYRRETARQLPTWRGVGGQALQSTPPPSPLATPMRMIESESHNVRTYVNRVVCKAHFKLNQAFKVIQGHPYWCQQESRMVCCRNVQLMPTLFLKLRRYGSRNTANSSISTTPLKFEDVPARNAFEYLQMIYIATNQSYCPTFLPLIVWVYIHQFSLIMLQSRTL